MKFFLLVAALVLGASALPSKKTGWYPTPPNHLEGLKSRNLKVMVEESFTKPRRTTPARHPISFEPSTKQDDDSCGVEDAISGRVVGGEETTAHQFPWLGTLKCNGNWFCTCSIASENWILTAAHCVDGCNDFTVTVGAWDQKNPDEFSVSHDMDGSHVEIHPGWSSSTLKDDIAMIHVQEGIKFNDAVRPICLPDKLASETFEDEVTTVAGWGILEDGQFSTPDRMNFYTGDLVMSNADCRAFYGSTITDGHICIATPDGAGVCSGDSGGALNWKSGENSQGKNQYMHIGVTSFVSGAGCASGNPHGFTRTTHYLDWINGNLGRQ